MILGIADGGLCREFGSRMLKKGLDMTKVRLIILHGGSNNWETFNGS
jgi:hypothetical protein